jgi:hypothetical protein
LNKSDAERQAVLNNPYSFGRKPKAGGSGRSTRGGKQTQAARFRATQPRTCHSYNEEELQQIQEGREAILAGTRTRLDVVRELGKTLNRAESGIVNQLRLMDSASSSDGFGAPGKKRKRSHESVSANEPPPLLQLASKSSRSTTASKLSSAPRQKTSLPPELRRLDIEPSSLLPRVSTRRHGYEETSKVTRSGISFWPAEEPARSAHITPSHLTNSTARAVDEVTPSVADRNDDAGNEDGVFKFVNLPPRVTPQEDTVIRNAYYTALQEGIPLEDCIESLQQELGRSRTTIVRRFDQFAAEVESYSGTRSDDESAGQRVLRSSAVALPGHDAEESSQDDHESDASDSSHGGVLEKRRLLVLRSSSDEDDDADDESDCSSRPDGPSGERSDAERNAGDSCRTDRAIRVQSAASTTAERRDGALGYSEWFSRTAATPAADLTPVGCSVARSDGSANSGGASASRSTAMGGSEGGDTGREDGGKGLHVLTLEELMMWSEEA